MNRFPALALTALLTCACGRPDSLGLIYLDGRAVEHVGDSLLAMTTQGLGGIIVYDLRTDTADTLGLGALHAPVHVEARRDRWYVSDIIDGRPHVSVLSWDGALETSHDLGDITSTPHQFATLPDDRIVVQSRDGKLLVVEGDSVATWALVDIGTRPSLLAGVAGGVLHTVPVEHITLYNEFGNIRWRIPWHWAETAFFTDIGTDRQGRIHLIAGVPDDGTFIVYTLGRNDGEILQWSMPGPHATFTIRRNGNFRPDSAVNWIGE
jgi:hypothetical protein